MGFFRFEGHQVWYEAVGCGEPMVLLHNGGNDHRVWEHQVAHFSRTHTVYVLDHLGYGRSDKPELDYDLPLYVRQLEAFFAHAGLGQAILLGHCIGGGMALAFALRHPGSVRALVLFNVATERTARAGMLRPLVAALAGRPRRQRLLSALTAKVGSPRWLTDALLRIQLGRGATPDPAFRDYQQALYNRPDQFRAFYSLCVRPESWGALDAVRKPPVFPPVLLVWGNDNRVLPVKAGRELCDRLRPTAVEFVEDAGHLVMRERPDFVNERIEAFLASRGILDGTRGGMPQATRDPREGSPARE